MKSRRHVFAGIALALIVGLLVSAKMPAATTASTLRKTAPDFALKDSQGATIRLSDYKGKVVLLDFWATWCGGCKIEIPWYVEFENRYKQRGLAAIGVSMDDDGWRSVRPFLAKNKLNYPIVIGNERLAQQYGINEMPLTLLIDRDGKIAESHSGMVDKN